MPNKKYVTLLVILLMGFTSHSRVLLSTLFGDKLNPDALEFGLMHKSWGAFELKLNNEDIKTKDYI